MPNPNEILISGLPPFPLPLTGTEAVPVDTGTTTYNVPVSALGALGAAPLGSLSADAAPYSGSVQAAVNALPAQGGTVWLSSQFYNLTRPLLLQSNYQRLQGVGPRDAVTVRAVGSWYGPLVAIVPKNKTPTLGASLLTGAGASLSLSGFGYFNLRDLPSCNLDGLSAFCVELAFKPSDATTQGNIIGSAGRRTSGEEWSNSWGLKVTGGSSGAGLGQVSGWLTIGGTKYTLNSSTSFLTNGTTAYIALAYDGSTLRLFGGPPGGTCALLASQAASGIITHPIEEDVTLGELPNTWPEGDGQLGPAAGLYDSVRLSNVARYTSAFTAPTAKTAKDSNGLFLSWFDTFLADGGTSGSAAGPVMGVWVGVPNGGTGWCVWRSDFFDQNLSDIEIKDLTFSGQTGANNIGLISQMCHFLVDNVWFNNVGRYGTLLVNNNFRTTFRRVKVNPAAGSTAPSGQSINHGALVFTAASGLVLLDNPVTDSFCYQLLFAGTGVLILQPDLTTGPNLVCQGLFKGSGSQADSVAIYGFAIDDETSNPPAGVAAVLWFDKVNSVVIHGGGVEDLSATNAHPTVKITDVPQVSGHTVSRYVFSCLFQQSSHVTQTFQSDTGTASIDYTGSVQSGPAFPGWGS